jgi:rhamnogalacturonan endolyase
VSALVGTAGVAAVTGYSLLDRPAVDVALTASTFGYTDDGANYVINTGADLVFKVSQINGDLTSLLYKGTEYQGYNGQNSQVESGLGAATVTISRPATGVILVTVVHGTMHHYYAARSGENNVYMWTDKADGSITATRYIVRVRPGLFRNDEPDSWDSRTDTLIEAQDVRVKPDGTTRSKHYSGQRVIDYDYVGWSNGSVGLWMVRSDHEKASGGPFYRSLIRHHYEDGAGLYEILYYGENQTEPERFGLHGPYILAFTDGGAPASALYARNRDTGWVDALGLVGWVGTPGRGRVAGTGIAGMDPDFRYTVGLANSAAQYWGTAAAGTGSYAIRNILPGTYALTIYKGELAVHTTTVTVLAGAVSALHTITVSGDPSTAPVIWRIGDWDGTPTGFKNAALMTHAHPSDVRADSWTGDYIVGTTADSSFPCYLWKDVNGGLKVYFRLTAAQLAAAHTLRIGITTAYANGRPRITVNDWTSSIPAATGEPGTRSLTVGSYRGNNHTYSFEVPAGAWLAEASEYNVLTINVVSGSGTTGYLSAGFALDCVELGA